MPNSTVLIVSLSIWMCSNTDWELRSFSCQTFTFSLLRVHPDFKLWGGGQRTIKPPFWTEVGRMVWNHSTDLLEPLHKGDWRTGGLVLFNPFKIGGLFTEVLKEGFWLKGELLSSFRSLKGSWFTLLTCDNWALDSPLNCWLFEQESSLRLCCKSGPFKRKLERSDSLLEENVESDWSLKGEKGSSLNGSVLYVGKRSDMDKTGLSSGVLEREDGYEMKGFPWLPSITKAKSRSRTLSGWF